MRWVPLILFLACGTSPEDAFKADTKPIAEDANDAMDARDDSDAENDERGPEDAVARTDQPADAAPYPIVLAHGFFGFEDFAGLNFATYFYQVRETLEANGHEVFTPAVDPFNNSTARGEALLEAVEAILSDSGHSKANLIGHSQGGLDSRYVAHRRPDLIASVTTIGTPHRGTPAADAIHDALGNDTMRQLLDSFTRLTGAPFFDESGAQTSVVAAIEQLTTEGLTQFNREVPDANSVSYFSIAGRSDLTRARAVCAGEARPHFISEYDAVVDPTDALLLLVEGITDGEGLVGIPNDGLVRVEDAKWGRFLGCIPADHFDEVGQILGDEPGLLNGWDHLEFYSDLVAFLRAEGF